MKIAFDVDGVLNEIIEFQMKKGKKYFAKKNQHKIVDDTAYEITDMFHCSTKQATAFWTKNIFKLCFGIKPAAGAKKLLQRLKKEGYQIFIVTKRAHTEEKNLLGAFMRFSLKVWFKKNKLVYDKMIFCQKDELKSDIIERNSIDLMVEDCSENANDLKKIIPVILVNAAHNKAVKGKYVYRVDDLDDVYLTIKEIEDMKNEKAKPLAHTGFNSIDRPSLQFFSKYEVERNRKKCVYSLYDMLNRHNKDFLTQKAITYGGKTINYKKLLMNIENIAQRLLRLGIKRKDVVTICMPNTPEGIMSFYAVNKIGAVSHMIHPKSAPEEIKRYVNEIKSKVFLTLDTNLESMQKIINDTCIEKVIFVSAIEFYPLGLPKVLYSIKNKVQIPKDERYVSWKKTNVKKKEYIQYQNKYDAVKDYAVIMRTSGSEGYDKAIYLSNQNLNENVIGFTHSFKNFKRGEFCPSIMPIFHGFGLCSSVHLPLLCGLLIEPIPRPNMKNILSTIKRKANYLIGVPTILSGLVNDEKVVKYIKRKGHHIKLFVCGGDAASKKISKKFNKIYKLDVSQGYGSTETTAGITFTLKEYSIKTSEIMLNKLAENSELVSENSILYTCGIPSFDTNVKIVSSSTGNELKSFRVGEIYINGPTIMLQISNKSVTDEVLHKHDDKLLWYKTGDYGFVDNEGRIYFVDRVSTTFKKNGYNIYPSKITKITESFDYVEKSAVVPIPDEMAKKRIGLLIKFKQGYELNEEIRKELMASFAEHLPIYHLPDVISATEEFKLTKKGSLNYKALKDQYLHEYKKKEGKSVYETINN